LYPVRSDLKPTSIHSSESIAFLHDVVIAGIASDSFDASHDFSSSSIEVLVLSLNIAFSSTTSSTIFSSSSFSGGVVAALLTSLLESPTTLSLLSLCKNPSAAYFLFIIVSTSSSSPSPPSPASEKGESSHGRGEIDISIISSSFSIVEEASNAL